MNDKFGRTPTYSQLYMYEDNFAPDGTKHVRKSHRKLNPKNGNSVVVSGRKSQQGIYEDKTKNIFRSIDYSNNSNGIKVQSTSKKRTGRSNLLAASISKSDAELPRLHGRNDVGGS